MILNCQLWWRGGRPREKVAGVLGAMCTAMQACGQRVPKVACPLPGGWQTPPSLIVSSIYVYMLRAMKYTRYTLLAVAT